MIESLLVNSFMLSMIFILTRFFRMKGIQCYLNLLLWIILVSFGCYWFLLRNEHVRINLISDSREDKTLIVNSRNRINTKQSVNLIPRTNVDRICNHPRRIKTQDENIEARDLELEGIVVVLRHGARGPLTHLGEKSHLASVNCSSGSNEDLDQFFSYADGMTRLNGYSTFIGPFSTFRRSPSGPRCELGQLTQLGAAQLLNVGKALRTAYGSLLSNNGSGKVIGYSTRYRRTLQSLLAFLYGLLGPTALITNSVLRESQSINFCFNDCSCKAAEKLKKAAAKAQKLTKKDKIEMKILIADVSSILGQLSNRGGSGILDVLLLFACHSSPFPCRENECVDPTQISSLVSLVEKEAEGVFKTSESSRVSLLSAYGLLKEILHLALRMTSRGNLGSGRIAVFSGHDVTLQSIIGALGISGHPDCLLTPFASRLVFEFWRKKAVVDSTVRAHFFKLIFNGDDVTENVRFCGKKLCPLENLVRFLHEAYFSPFGNVTNFRDACQAKKVKLNERY